MGQQNDYYSYTAVGINREAPYYFKNRNLLNVCVCETWAHGLNILTSSESTDTQSLNYGYWSGSHQMDIYQGYHEAS